MRGKAKAPPPPRWITKRAALAIHEQLLAAHGGRAGFLDERLLDSALDSPKNHFAHGETDLFQLAGVYGYALTQNHPFVDGNKRLALTVAATFLERNGYRLMGPEHEAVQIVLDLSSRKADASGFAQWLRDNVQRATRQARAASKPKAARIRVVKKRK